jgi:hypothetical protein
MQRCLFGKSQMHTCFWRVIVVFFNYEITPVFFTYHGIFFYSKIKSNLSEISRVKLEHLVHVSLVSFIPFTPKTSTLKSSFKFRLMAADFCGCASGSRVLQSHSHSQKVLQSHPHSHLLAGGVALKGAVRLAPTVMVQVQGSQSRHKMSRVGNVS